MGRWLHLRLRFRPRPRLCFRVRNTGKGRIQFSGRIPRLALCMPRAAIFRINHRSGVERCFVYTSNVDCFFRRSGWAEQQLLEIHGNMQRWQCSLPCKVTLLFLIITSSRHSAGCDARPTFCTYYLFGGHDDSYWKDTWIPVFQLTLGANAEKRWREECAHRKDSEESWVHVQESRCSRSPVWTIDEQRRFAVDELTMRAPSRKSQP